MKGTMKQILALLLISTLAAEAQTNRVVFNTTPINGNYITTSNNISIVSGQCSRYDLSNGNFTNQNGFYIYKDYKLVGQFESILVGFNGSFIRGRYVYFASGLSGLTVFDIINPSNPTLVTSLSGLGFCNSCDGFSNKLVMACGSTGIHIIDVTSPTSPVKLGTVKPYSTSAPTANNAIFVSSNLVAMSGLGLVALVNCSNPSNMVEVGSYTTTTTGGSFVGAKSTNGILFVAANGAGVVSLNISNPSTPVFLSRLMTAPNGITDLEIQGTNIIFAQQERGIGQYYISPSNTLNTSNYGWKSPGSVNKVNLDLYGNLLGAESSIGLFCVGTNFISSSTTTNFIVYSGGCSNDVGMTNVVFEFSTNTANFSAAVWEQFPNCTNNFEPIDPALHTNIPATYMRVRKVP